MNWLYFSLVLAVIALIALTISLIVWSYVTDTYQPSNSVIIQDYNKFDHANCSLNKEKHQEMRILLLKFDKVARENKIEYFLYGDSLLALEKIQDFFPWSKNIEIAIAEADFLKIDFIKEVLDKQHWKVEKHKNHYRLYHKDNYLIIHTFTINGNELSIGKKKLPVNHIFPLRKEIFSDIEIYSVKDISKIINKIYSNNKYKLTVKCDGKEIIMVMNKDLLQKIKDDVDKLKK